MVWTGLDHPIYRRYQRPFLECGLPKEICYQNACVLVGVSLLYSLYAFNSTQDLLVQKPPLPEVKYSFSEALLIGRIIAHSLVPEDNAGKVRNQRMQEVA